MKVFILLGFLLGLGSNKLPFYKGKNWAAQTIDN